MLSVPPASARSAVGGNAGACKWEWWHSDLANFHVQLLTTCIGYDQHAFQRQTPYQQLVHIRSQSSEPGPWLRGDQSSGRALAAGPE